MRDTLQGRINALKSAIESVKISILETFEMVFFEKYVVIMLAMIILLCIANLANVEPAPQDTLKPWEQELKRVFDFVADRPERKDLYIDSVKVSVCWLSGSGRNFVEWNITIPIKRYEPRNSPNDRVLAELRSTRWNLN